MLRDYAQAGLTVLSLSRHHHDASMNAALMGLDTHTPRILHSYAALPPGQRPARLRLICVLQHDGIDSPEALRAYIDWAVAQGVRELCFKELYVSTTLESAYHAHPNNQWSRQHQVTLALVSDLLQQSGFSISTRLPWGAPVYRGNWQGQPLQVAAYTEPSVYWERNHGIARSWNLMADGRCLVSLEDLHSKPDVCRCSFLKAC